MIETQPRFGTVFVEGGVRFRFYASAAQTIALELADAAGNRSVPMQPAGAGWFEAFDERAGHGTRYAFRIDGAGQTVPDPASRFQPEGVHAPSMVVDTRAFAWPDRAWMGHAWNAYAICELHVGTFTPEGTYAAAAERLDELAATGFTAIELMPLAATPGDRNWGYDGVLWYAPAERYGTPEELRSFIAAAHERGLAVLLDVVYNHFGPEGNYLHVYAPDFFTDAYQTPWGAAIDYGGCDAARVSLPTGGRACSSSCEPPSPFASTSSGQVRMNINCRRCSSSRTITTMSRCPMRATMRNGTTTTITRRTSSRRASAEATMRGTRRGRRGICSAALPKGSGTKARSRRTRVCRAAHRARAFRS